jgi:hypothetical protein
MPSKAVHKFAKDSSPASRTAVSVAEKEKSSISSPESFPEEFEQFKRVQYQIQQVANNLDCPMKPLHKPDRLKCK